MLIVQDHPADIARLKRRYPYMAEQLRERDVSGSFALI